MGRFQGIDSRFSHQSTLLPFPQTAACPDIRRPEQPIHKPTIPPSTNFSRNFSRLSTAIHRRHWRRRTNPRTHPPKLECRKFGRMIAGGKDRYIEPIPGQRGVPHPCDRGQTDPIQAGDPMAYGGAIADHRARRLARAVGSQAVAIPRCAGGSVRPGGITDRHAQRTTQRMARPIDWMRDDAACGGCG